MSDGWGGGGSRHESEPAAEDTDDPTDLHQALVEAHRAVRQGERSNRLQARDRTLRATLDALLETNEAERLAREAAALIDAKEPSDVTESQLLVLFARVGLADVAPDVNEAAADALAEYVREHEI